MLRNTSSSTRRALFGAFFAIILLLPLTVFSQSLIVVRPGRRHVVVYRPYQRPYYTSSYYSNPFYSYGYTQPFYGTSYYSSTYSPYYVNPYAYSVYPNYSYGFNTYRPRHRRMRLGIWLR